MAVKRVRDAVPKIRQQLLRQSLDQAEVQGRRAGAVYKRLLMKTLKHSLTSGEYALADASVRVTVETRTTRRGPVVKINMAVVDSGGQPHRLWHYLEGGTKGRKQRKTSPPIRERKAGRTFIGKLEVDRFKGFTGQTFVIPKGAFVQGIPARKWYEIAADMGEQKLARDKALKRWNVRRAKVKRPKV